MGDSGGDSAAAGGGTPRRLNSGATSARNPAGGCSEGGMTL
jgi:hypothetical protein